MKIKKNNRKKRIFFIIFIFVIIIGLTIVYKNKDTISNIIGLSEEVSLDANYSEYEEIGQNAYISSVAITKTKTGVGPFDDETTTDSSNGDGSVTWTAGDDWSEDDNIVRSFDQITWAVESTLSLKDEASSESYKGGVICIEASVPEELADLVEWDLDSMTWAENATVSDDGTKLIAYYTMTDTEKTVPGKQDLVLVLHIYGSSNGTEIVPTFNVSLYGNDEGEEASIDGSKIYVSAAGRYNISIGKNSKLNYAGYFDLQSGKEVTTLTDTSVNGRIQGYGIVVQLYNNSTDKELKGIEIPQGNVEFDINLSESIRKNSEDLTDSDYIPILWDYNENMNNTDTGKFGRNLLWAGTKNTRYYSGTLIPFNKNTDRNAKYCYDGGTWTIEQTDTTTYHVTIKDYVFDTEEWFFPTKGAGSATAGDSVEFESYIGCFSAGYIEVILQFPDDTNEVESLYLNVSISNLHMTTISGKEITEEVNTTDNSRNTAITLYDEGGIQKYNKFLDDSGSSLESVTNTGDAVASIGEDIRIDGSIYVNSSTDYNLKSVNILQKFDDDAFEIPTGSDSSSGSRIIK